jgi:hypothetical protein
MYMSRSKVLSLMLAAALAMGQAGCVVSPPQGSVVVRDEVVLRAPPAALSERRVYAPGPGYVWIGGYWNWVAGRHVWVAGRWAAPRAGYVWVPHAWVHYGQGWRLREGYWRRSHR